MLDTNVLAYPLFESFIISVKFFYVYTNMSTDNTTSNTKLDSSKKDNERVAGSNALRKWFKSDEDAQRHVNQLRYNEKLVNGVYVEDPDLTPEIDPFYPRD